MRSGFLWWPKMIGKEGRWLMRAEWEEELWPTPAAVPPFGRLAPFEPYWKPIRWTEDPPIPVHEYRRPSPPPAPPPPPRRNPWDGYTDPDVIAAIQSTVPTVLGGTAPSTVEEWERWEKEHPRIVSPAGDPFAAVLGEEIWWGVKVATEPWPPRASKAMISDITDVVITHTIPMPECQKPADISAYQGESMDEMIESTLRGREAIDGDRKVTITPQQFHVFGDCPVCLAKHGQRCTDMDDGATMYNRGHLKRQTAADGWIRAATPDQLQAKLDEIPPESLEQRPEPVQPIQIDPSRLAELTAYHRPENHEFRAVYRQLSPEEQALMRAIKDQAFLLLGLINHVKHLQDRAEATRKLRESVMWAVHGITA